MQLFSCLILAAAVASAMPMDLFEQFMRDHNKQYSSEGEKHYRFNVFQQVRAPCARPAAAHAPRRPSSASMSSTPASPSAPTASTSSPT